MSFRHGSGLVWIAWKIWRLPLSAQLQSNVEFHSLRRRMAPNQRAQARNPETKQERREKVCWLSQAALLLRIVCQFSCTGLLEITDYSSTVWLKLTETPATIDLAKDMPGPTPAFSGLSACKGCLATLQVPPAILRIRESYTESPTISPRPDILLWPAKRNMAIGETDVWSIWLTDQMEAYRRRQTGKTDATRKAKRPLSRKIQDKWIQCVHTKGLAHHKEM